ncbi:MAG: hypothetical protein GXY36_02240 [Chloroflexi bacterium]|jgi:hypothetical protein|nr:hypothetical protein [Chloroflexota bacterium]
MRIHVVRSGGFSGIRMEGEVDTGRLPESVAEELRTLLTEANFFALPSDLTTLTRGADQFNYEVTVEDDSGQVHTVTTNEAGIPPELRALAHTVLRGSRTQSDE